MIDEKLLVFLKQGICLSLSNRLADSQEWLKIFLDRAILIQFFDASKGQRSIEILPDFILFDDMAVSDRQIASRAKIGIDELIPDERTQLLELLYQAQPLLA
ncbi:MAG: hypothetical protein BWY75_03686 [bacterium ADurb.Bin425]|nr:MAG: hypothetical protein BWY75_03686 [bacterium ADurb.Bin425]